MAQPSSCAPRIECGGFLSFEGSSFVAMAGMKGGVSNKRKKKSNESAQGPVGKRKQKQGVPGVPDLPPDVNEEDVYVSDEDLDFVQKHAQYAGFMANLDTATIDK